MTRRRRWRFTTVAALALLALALLYTSPLLLAATVVPLSFVVYGSLSTLPDDAAVRVERSFDDRTPQPGERVTVEVTIENTGAATIPDLRVVDGVPDALAVVDGSPRTSAPLRPGDEATFAYTVVARRGEYAFDDPVVRLRSLSGARSHTATVPAAGSETLSVLNPLSEPPLSNTTLLRTGTYPTDSGGDGLEFRSTRDYQPGDPINRIHWRQFAKTGTLTTVSYREERAVRTVVVVDARTLGAVTPQPGHPTGRELCGYAGQRLYEALVEADVVTSVAAVGLRDESLAVPTGPGRIPWVDGESDHAVQLAERVFEAVQTADVDTPAATGPRADRVAAQSTAVPDGGESTDGDSAADDGGESTDGDSAADDDIEPTTAALLSQFPPDAQVVFVTPLLDDWPVDLSRRLGERGYPFVVLSPDVTGDSSLGATVLGLEREERLETVEAAGGTTVSWTLDRPMDVALSTSLTHLLST